jgi:hypothetical protein
VIIGFVSIEGNTRLSLQMQLEKKENLVLLESEPARAQALFAKQLVSVMAFRSGRTLSSTV